MEEKGIVFFGHKSDSLKTVAGADKHNDRKSIIKDPDYRLEKSLENYYFIKCDPSSAERIKEMIKNGELILKKDGKFIDSMVISVSTPYIQQHGGRSFAIKLYGEVLRCFVSFYGSEVNIISAVLHCDEISYSYSKKFKCPVYNYHLHIIAVPTARKMDKDGKDLGRTISKCVWGFYKVLDEYGNPLLSEKGKPIKEKSFTVMQSLLAAWLQKAGYDVVRGVPKSGFNSLNETRFKVEQAEKELDEITAKIEQETIKYEIVHKENVEHSVVGEMFHRSMIGGYSISGKNMETVNNLIDEAFASRAKIRELEAEKEELHARIDALTKENRTWREKFEALKEQCSLYLDAVKKCPKEIEDFLYKLLHRLKPKKKTSPSKTETIATGEKTVEHCDLFGKILGLDKADYDHSQPAQPSGPINETPPAESKSALPEPPKTFEPSTPEYSPASENTNILKSAPNFAPKISDDSRDVPTAIPETSNDSRDVPAAPETAENVETGDYFDYFDPYGYGESDDFEQGDDFER